MSFLSFHKTKCSYSIIHHIAYLF